jgi:predicted nicotinamide N-methyase
LTIKATIVSDNHFITYKKFKVVRSTHPQVRKIKRLQKGHSAHGNKVWRSAFVLIDYLTTYPLESGAKVLDIGCGWGLSGLYLNKNYNAQVMGIDIDPTVEPYIKLQGEINQCTMGFEKRSFESFTASELSYFDYLIGADICFWDEMTDPLFNLIKRARKGNVQKILIADPGRPPFWDLADRCANKLQSEVITRRLCHPWKTEKYILVI